MFLRRSTFRYGRMWREEFMKMLKGLDMFIALVFQASFFNFLRKFGQ
jgi:hypothetical protein